ncbi:hypothetical protein DIPPA_23492 [Diplonema papillatum]|nr:hypothetical protein DIPPA_23492 [Diplonema papillatum]
MPIELEVFDGSMEEVLEKVSYEHDIKPEDFSAYEKFKKGSLGITTTFPNADLATVFSVLLADNTPFYKDYRLSSRGDKDFEETEWSTGQSTSATRLFKCQTKVKEVLTWNWVAYNEKQRFIAFQAPGNSKMLLVQLSSQTPGVTFGDKFRVESLLEFKESDGKVTLEIFVYVHFMGSVGFLEGKVRSVSATECAKSYRFYVELAAAAVARKTGGGKKGKKTDARRPKKAPASPNLDAEPSPVTPTSHHQDDQSQLVLYVGGACAFLLLVVIYLLLARQPEPEPSIFQDQTLMQALGVERSSDVENMLLMRQLGINSKRSPMHYSRMAGGMADSEEDQLRTILKLLELQDKRFVAFKSNLDWYLSCLTIVTFLSLILVINSMRQEKRA